MLHRATGELEHRRFRDLADYVPADDVIVVNASRVFRARLLGKRDSGAPAEVLLLRQLPGEESRFEAMVHPGGKLHPGRRVVISDELSVIVESVTERRTRIVRLQSSGDVWNAIDKYGHVPLPPYITRADESADAASYQTVFARERGSAAAPTAGLHFTEELRNSLAERGVRFAEVVLHVGAGTFKPLETEDPAMHRMHEEWYSVPPGAVATIRAVQREGGRVWAAGTTVLRTLESNVQNHGAVTAESGETRLFVRPPFEFRVVDHLLTNFHLPRSTLIMLVAAFAGYELTMRAYREAVDARYRFYSYGDAMLIV